MQFRIYRQNAQRSVSRQEFFVITSNSLRESPPFGIKKQLQNCNLATIFAFLASFHPHLAIF